MFHAGFVLFVLFGGVLVVRRPSLAWMHVPAAVWGVLVEYAGWICPLTPLENALREQSGLGPYSGDFIEQYVLPVLYPAHLRRLDQFVLGTIAFAVNATAYWWVIRTRRLRSRAVNDLDSPKRHTTRHRSAAD